MKAPLRLSCTNLHTCGSLDAIGDYTCPHAPHKGFVPQIMRPMCLPRATACAPTCRNFRSHAPHVLSLAFTHLNPPADVIANVIYVSLRCAVVDVTCLRQLLTSSFDFGGLTVDLAGLTVDFSPGLTFAVQVFLTQFFT